MQDNGENLIAFDKVYRHIMSDYATEENTLSSAISNYLVQVIGVSKGDIELIRGKLIENYPVSDNDITVKFNTKGGIVMPDATLKFGSSIKDYIPKHTNTDYKFEYWTLNGEPIDSETFLVTEDITLVAVWKKGWSNNH